MDARENAYVLWFDELRRADVGLVGGKSSSLGELTSSVDVPVPYGYATTASAYRYFMEKTGQNKKIHKMLQELQDVEDSVELHEVCTKSVKASALPLCRKTLPNGLERLMKNLPKRWGKRILSSPSAPLLPRKICRMLLCRAAGYIPECHRAGYGYPESKGMLCVHFHRPCRLLPCEENFDHENVALSAAVQMMADAKAAGVMFTVNLATGADDSIMIEGSWGLGEYIVQGTVTPDNLLWIKILLLLLPAASMKIHRTDPQRRRRCGRKKSGTGTCQSAGYKR